MNKKVTRSANVIAIEAAALAHSTARYVLKLYIAGSTPRSSQALSNIRRICDEHLEGRYDLDIVDISLHHASAEDEQIVAAPTLIKLLPLPRRRFIGDMSQSDRILLGLDIRAAAALPPLIRNR